MASTFTSSTLPQLYKDDYDSADNYHQILFNSGRALQARELTQLQTLIYEEMGRFGSNVFKEGSAVSFGNIAINASYDFIQIETVTGGAFADIPVGTVFTEAGSNIKVKVLQVLPAETLVNPDTLFVTYINGGGTAINGTPPTVSVGGELLGGNFTLTVHESGQNDAPFPTGRAVKLDVDQGDFFVMGRFVHSNAQSIILSPTSQIVNTIVGFKIIQEVITVNDTQDLYDNAGSSPNLASPGADRYRIRLELVEKDPNNDTDTFVFLARIENSKIVETVDVLDSYNKINDVLALRTEEESGDYIVNPFTIGFDSADAENLSLTISEGTAYVNGYRVENPSPTKLIVPRSIGDGELVNNDVIPVTYGNYVLIDSTTALPTFDYSQVNICSDTIGSSVIGTCRIRGVEPSGSQLKMYLFDIEINPNENFNTAKSITQFGAGDTQLLNTNGTSAQLFGSTDNDLLFQTSRPRPSSFSDIIITTQKSVTKIAEVTGNTITLDNLPGGETYENSSQWIIVEISGANGPAFIPTTVTGIGTNAVTISDPLIADGEAYQIIHYVKNSSATQKSKSLTSLSGYFDVVSGEVDLGLPDVSQVEVVKVVGAGPDVTTGPDCSERFILDDGQRDNYYQNGKLILKGGETDPTRVYVEFTYWARGGIGGAFYSPQNYSASTYGNIPDHVLQDGSVISLRNYLDFRPDKDAAGNFSNISFLPTSGTSISADVTYHLPRADKVLITQEGDLQVLMGQQSRDPQLKKTPDNALELYQVLMNANTIDENDVQIKPIEHKLYTMADIAKLDDKIENLKEYTELNIAELRAFHTPSLDSAGLERPDSGIVVDNGEDQTGSATEDGDYSASLDPENQLIRPMVDEDNIRLVIETLSGVNYGNSNVVKKGDNVYLGYDSAEWKFQNLASRSIKVNPYGMVDNVGVIKLSPSTDEWKESKEEAIKAVVGTSKLDTKQAFLWNSWQWNWKGRNDEDLWISDDTKSGFVSNGIRRRLAKKISDSYNSTRFNNRSNRGYVRRVVARDSLRMRIGNRFVDVALIPWIRSRKIFFHAKGLTPNTKFTPFFDGVDVSAWCKSETSFVAFSDRNDDLGNQNTYNSLTQHPEGTEELISNSQGECIGSFFIPNLKPVYYLPKKFQSRRLRNSYLRFRAGIREFKLLDINENDWSKANSKAFAYYSVVGALNNKTNHMLTTRGYQTTLPLGLGFSSFPSAYSPRDLKNSLDAQNASIGIINAQLAGKYSPITEPLTSGQLTTLDANGEMSQVLSDYINVNNNQYSNNYSAPNALPQNPLAQTFYVDNQFGVVLTKISLFFKSKSQDDLPVSIHLRPVINGKPSNTDIVPDSHVFKNATEVNVASFGDVFTMSKIKSDYETEFVFDEPVFLQPWTSYAVVITSPSEDYEIFSAKTKDYVLGNSGKSISTQAGSGSLFLPQNGVVWLESKNQDLMMRLARAQFNISGGSLFLKNAPLPAKQLEPNPIRLNGTTSVYVKAPCHGLAVGDTVQLANCEDVSNITAATLNTTHIVDAIDADGYQFVIGTTATESVSGGGDQCLSSRNLVFDVVNPNMESIIPNFTSLDYSAKFISGAHVSQPTSERFLPNGLGGAIISAKFEKITPDQNTEFDKPRAVYNSSVVDATSHLGSTTAGDTESVYMKIDFKSSNDYVSPILDLSRCSLTVAGECIFDGNQTPSLHPVAETSPSGGTDGPKHITTPITLEVPGVSMDVRAEVTVPPDANIDFYYRTATADQNISEVPWRYQPPVNPIPNSTSGTVQAQWLPGGKNGSLDPFMQSQTKFVMRGQGKGPSIQLGTGGILTRIHAV